MNLFQITVKNTYSYNKEMQSRFYKQVVKFWFEIYSIKPELKYRDQKTLWNNCRILINYEPIDCSSK